MQLYKFKQNSHLFADDFLSFSVAVEEEGMSAVQFFFTILFSVLGVGVLAVVGLVVYGRWKENRRKRFYWPKTNRSHTGFQNVCFLICEHDDNAKAAIALLKPSIEWTEWTSTWIWSSEPREHTNSQDEQKKTEKEIKLWKDVISVRR